jgi:hypothetical protein
MSTLPYLTIKILKVIHRLFIGVLTPLWHNRCIHLSLSVYVLLPKKGRKQWILIGDYRSKS